MDLDARFRQMGDFGDYRQVISLPAPALEEVAEPELAARLARLGNNGLADLAARHPDCFPAFVAAVALGQKFVPDLHDPEHRAHEAQNAETLTDEDVDRLFDAMVAALDAQPLSDPEHKLE